MKRTWTKIAGAVLVIAALGLSPSSAQALRKIQPNAVPPGAIKLGTSYKGPWTKKLVSADRLHCWPIRGRHVPGEQLGVTNKSGSRWVAFYFLSYEQRAKNAINAAKKTSGARRTALLAEAKTFTDKNITQFPYCKKWDSPQFAISNARAVGLLDARISKASSDLFVDHVRIFSLYETWGSNLVAVDGNGAISDSLTTGSLDIGSIHVAPSGKVYVRLRTPQVLAEDGMWQTVRTPNIGCVLAEVVVSTGNLTCVDETLGRVTDTLRVGASRLGSEFVQFDDFGGIYYTGYGKPDGTKLPSFVLRKSINGAATDLINDQISLADFMVLPDGSVLISGTTTATLSRWTRRISPTGSLSGLASKSCSFRKFPDANVFAYCESSWYRFDTVTNSLVSANLDASTSATSVLGALSDGSVVSRSGSVFSRMYPIQSTIATSQVTTIQTARVSSDYILISGLKDGKNVTTVVNGLTGAETVLLTSTPDEFEIYHFGDVATASGVTIVDGLRFSDNKYFTGRLNVRTGDFTISLTGVGKFADFQAVQ